MDEVSAQEKIQFIINNSLYDLSDLAEVLDVPIDILKNNPDQFFTQEEKITLTLNWLYKMTLELN